MPTAFTDLTPPKQEHHVNAMMRVNVLTSSQLLQPCEAPHLFKPGAQTHGSLRTKVKVPPIVRGCSKVH